MLVAAAAFVIENLRVTIPITSGLYSDGYTTLPPYKESHFSVVRYVCLSSDDS